MLRKVSSTLLTCSAIVLAASLLAGCTTPRYDGSRAPDPAKAIIIGSITEGFLTQPHGLQVQIKARTEPSATIDLKTMFNEDDRPSPNLLGNLFMYEVPAGQYEFTSWSYYYYAGYAMTQPAPVVFSVKAGEIAYIGDLYANALTFCLSNVDHGNDALTALKQKYPMLRDKQISNVTAQSAFKPWPTSDAKDSGKGLCTF
ncbi:hypothetical protein ACQR3P_01140 [Rhodococcus sp. IEGM1300]|jgi:hypothetical protein